MSEMVDVIIVLMSEMVDVAVGWSALCAAQSTYSEVGVSGHRWW